MRIAICAPFMQSDLWQERIRRLLPEKMLEFDEFYDADGIRRAGTFRYDLVVAAMGGETGTQMVTLARERDREVPLLWLSDDEHDGLTAYKVKAGMFLMLDCTDGELSRGLHRCLGE